MKQNIFLLIGLALLTCSCNDFLDREPLDSVPVDKYLLNENDLAAYTASLYEVLPTYKPGVYGIGVLGTDNNSDNQAGSNPEKLFVNRENRVPASGGAWNFSEIRSVNYFINKVRPRLESGELMDSEKNKHYLGEAYFFRAFLYTNKLDSIGDFPIIKNIVKDDYESVKKASERRPRNEVARFIIQDLDSAYYFMSATPPVSNRLTKDCAALLKSRVALFEGTWEKYHRGTSRVPGGPGWPGAKKAYLKDYNINIDDEIKYFLTEAKKAAQIVADNHQLSDDYEALFNSNGNSLDGVGEVLLYRAYNADITPSVTHFTVGYLQRDGGGNTGFTRSMIESYLMKSGLPIYADGNYKGDKTYTDVAYERDPRMLYNTIMPGDKLSEQTNLIEAISDGVGYYYRAPITAMAENRCTTGYSLKKGLNTDAAQGPTLPSITACIVFRAAEAYLNYIEADCELNNSSLDANSIKYWEAIRRRAGMDTDFNKTISKTDLTKEIDLARYSGDNLVDATLYNIRRERRVEFAAEGFRLRDLRRWRALDKMKDYHVEGFNLWEENYKRYTTPDAGVNSITFTPALKPVSLVESGNDGANVSAKSDGNYLLPYRVMYNNIAYNGYNWNPNRYLFPIAFDHFRLTTEVEGSGDYESSPIYQNPGWKIETNSLPEGE